MKFLDLNMSRKTSTSHLLQEIVIEIMSHETRQYCEYRADFFILYCRLHIKVVVRSMYSIS